MKHLDLEVQRELGTIVVESKVDWVEFSTSAIIFLPLLYQMIFESVKVEDLIEIGFLLSLFIILLFVAPSLWIPPFSEIPSLKKIVMADQEVISIKVRLSNLHIEYDKKNKIGKREFVARHMLYS